MRRQCTPDNPYTKKRSEMEVGYGWEHQEAAEIPDSQRDGWPSGDTVRMKCKTCGVEWIKELPQ